ncbi:MAG: RsmE family RNA methyltransferase [Flavobacteriaceae bacterium]
MELFYHESLSAKDNNWKISREESRHLEKVLRKKIGDQVLFTNGKGLLHHAEIEQMASSGIQVRSIKHQQFSPPKQELHMAIAPTKNMDRLEWFLEKATEIGIQHITPLLCERSERKVIKVERLEKILIRALKQSHRYFLPELHPMRSFKDYVGSLTQPSYLAHCSVGEKKSLWDIPLHDDQLSVLIGPEGDFSPAEISFAQQYTIEMLDLGDMRLRTETAGLLVVSAFNRLQQQKA